MRRVSTQTRRIIGAAFTLVEILISILILALGVLGLGALFPVIIREQRLGADATYGVFASNTARSTLTQAAWGTGLVGNGGGDHPALDRTSSSDGVSPTEWLWRVLRNNVRYSGANTLVCSGGLGRGYNSAVGSQNQFQFYGQGEWFTGLVDQATGVAKIGYPNLTTGTPAPVGPPQVQYNGLGTFNGCVDLAVAQRLFPASHVDIPAAQRPFRPSERLEPQFVWDFAVQRVTDFDHTHPPDWDDLRAVVFVRRIDPRIRFVGGAKSVLDALTGYATSAPEFRFPVGESITTGDPTLDGTGRYCGIKTCEVAFYYVGPNDTLLNHRDRLYFPNTLANGAAAPTNWLQTFAQMRQPGQKLVDNMGNVYTVVGSGKEVGVAARIIDATSPGAEYLKIDPPVPESVTAERAAPMATETSYAGDPPVKRAIWQVAFTPQIPVSVTLVDVAKGTRAAFP